MSSTAFTPEHELFRKSVREYVEKRLRPNAEAWEAQQIFPREVFKEMGDLGFLGIRAPESYGGSGLDYWYTVVFAEELTRSSMAGLNMSMLVQTDMATPIIWEIGDDHHKRNFGVPAMKGEAIAALGVSEPNAGSDVAGIQTTARRDGDDYVINGQKTFITNGTRADFITLAVRTGGEGYGGISLVMFPTDTKGFQVGRALKKIGNHTSDTAELFFEDCRIPVKNRLGEEGHGFYYIMRNFQGERLAAAIISVAGAQHLWEETVAYANDRKAFGRPIGSFQVWKHKLVEHLTSIEAARRLTYHACDLFNRKEEAIREITMAKLFAGDLLQRVGVRLSAAVWWLGLHRRVPDRARVPRRTPRDHRRGHLRDHEGDFDEARAARFEALDPAHLLHALRGSVYFPRERGRTRDRCRLRDGAGSKGAGDRAGDHRPKGRGLRQHLARDPLDLLVGRRDSGRAGAAPLDQDAARAIRGVAPNDRRRAPVPSARGDRGARRGRAPAVRGVGREVDRMRRLLVVATNRALTKFVAEALLGRGLSTSPPRSSDAWDIARAHSGTEAYLFVTRGGRLRRHPPRPRVTGFSRSSS